MRHLGAFKKTFIQEPKPAVVTARFTLSEIRKDVIYIPQGTRVTAGDGVYFATDDYAEGKAGDSFVDVDCTCETVGEVGNEYIVGQIEVFVSVRRAGHGIRRRRQEDSFPEAVFGFFAGSAV